MSKKAQYKYTASPEWGKKARKYEAKLRRGGINQTALSEEEAANEDKAQDINNGD